MAKTLLLCDSTLTGHPSKKVPGALTGRTSLITILRERHPDAVYIDMTIDGCTLDDIVRLLLRIPTESRADYDHTLVVAMFIGRQKALLRETSQIGVLILQLCEALKEHRRPLVVLGGDATMWGYDGPYDSFVQRPCSYARVRASPR